MVLLLLKDGSNLVYKLFLDHLVPRGLLILPNLLVDGVLQLVDLLDLSQLKLNVGHGLRRNEPGLWLLLVEALVGHGLVLVGHPLSLLLVGHLHGLNALLR